MKLKKTICLSVDIINIFKWRYDRRTLDTRGFSRACGGSFRCWPKAEAFRADHYKDLTETGNRARKVSGTQGMIVAVVIEIYKQLQINPKEIFFFHVAEIQNIRT